MHPVATDLVKARGHGFVSLRHPTTIEITKESEMTRKGDCVLAVGASKGASELDERLKSALRKGGRLIVTIECAGLRDVIRSMGSDRMTFRDQNSIVLRRSAYVDGRTIGILSNKAAQGIDRGLASRLKDEGAIVFVRLEAFVNLT